MSATYEKDNNKTTWCPPQYAMELNKQGYKIIEIYPCRFGAECRGAHSKDEIVTKQHISKWEKCDKSHINLLTIMENIIKVIESEKEMVINSKYRSLIQTIHSLRFEKLLEFWFEITCYHRRISKNKDLPTKKAWFNKSKPPPIEGYHYKDDVPYFALENEDNVWALERTFHMCNKYTSLDRSVKISVKSICCGDINCKEGVHDESDLVCIDDMLTGSCSCMPKDEYVEKTKTIADKIKSLKLLTENTVDEDGFEIKINKKTRDNNLQQIAEKQKELNSIIRKVHMTEYGLIPLSVRIQENAKTAPAAVDVSNIEVKTVKKVMKKTY